MAPEQDDALLQDIKKTYPEKFVTEDRIFSHVHPGDTIFIGTGCGEPQYLVQAMIRHIQSHPKAFVDTELLQICNLGVNSYAEEQYKDNFRFNSFFIGNTARDAVNEGLADYTPIFLSDVPELFYRKRVPVDVALIQASVPDAHGFVSLGISVDIVKAAVESAPVVIAQINAAMPRVHGDTFIHVRDINFIVPQVAAGPQPLVVRVGGVQSQTVTLNVRE